MKNETLMGFMASCAAHLSFAVDPGTITSGRARALVAVFAGLISLIIGGLARARAGNGRALAIVAVVLGVIGIILSVVHLSTVTGGFGSGSGRAGAIVALVLSLIGTSLGSLTLARSRHRRSTG
jgi:FtsH-binding integral membrane protein